MKVISASFSVAEYCDQMQRKDLLINHEYQRSSKVWPPAAKSYLIDTILHGFPVPKLSLYQKTDLKTKTTYKEIVDGQQRSQAIYDFFQNKLRLSGKSEFSGKTFAQLDEELQRRFIEYALSVDIFVGATDQDVRQVFRRINSYNVPLNAQEKRHALYQGELKWFVVEMSETYDQALKNLGVYKEAQLSRMADAALFSELLMTFAEGLKSHSESNIEKFYRAKDPSYPETAQMKRLFDATFRRIISWDAIHNGPLMKAYNFFTLFLAISHVENRISALQVSYPIQKTSGLSHDYVLPNLTSLAEALEAPEQYPNFKDFVTACSQATNRLPQRKTRFEWLCRALTPTLLE